MVNSLFEWSQIKYCFITWNMKFFQCLNFKCQLKIAFKSPLLWKSIFSWFHFVSPFKLFLLFTQLYLKILQCSDLPILVNKLVHFSLYFYFSVLQKHSKIYHIYAKWQENNKLRHIILILQCSFVTRHLSTLPNPPFYLISKICSFKCIIDIKFILNNYM